MGRTLTYAHVFAGLALTLGVLIAGLRDAADRIKTDLEGR